MLYTRYCELDCKVNVYFIINSSEFNWDGAAKESIFASVVIIVFVMPRSLATSDRMEPMSKLTLLLEEALAVVHTATHN